MASSESNLDKLEDIGKSIAQLSGTALAQAIGMWTAARAAISTVAGGIAAAAAQKCINTAMAKYLATPLSPPVLADMIVRNVLTDDTGAAGATGAGYPKAYLSEVDGNSPTAEAALSGLHPDRFKAMVYDTGESYGIIDALRLYNRGLSLYALEQAPTYSSGLPLYQAGASLATTWGVTKAELDAVIAYSRTRPQFTPDLLKLARDTLSGATAVEMAVKEVVAMDVAQDLYVAAGGIGEQFPAIVAAAGDAAGLEKACALWMHGLITKAELLQVLGMSRVNPRFYPLYTPRKTTAAAATPGEAVDAAAPGTYASGWLIPASAKYLGAFEVGDLVKNNAVTPAAAEKWLVADGYPEDQAHAFAYMYSVPSTAIKQQTEAMVLDEYAAGTLSEKQATQSLTDMGYTVQSIPVILASVTARTAISARNSAVARVKAAYLHGAITVQKAATDLGALGVPAAAIANYTKDWAVEASTPTVHLSESMVGWLLEKGHITAAQAHTKWVALGLTSDDADLLALRYPVPKAPLPPTVGLPLHPEP